MTAMTWYLFRCEGPDCGADREETYSFRSAPAVGEVVQLDRACPDCGSHLAKRRPGGGGFVLRGSGWGRDGG